ncbi:PDDEXK nuclease domain-containing protein [Kribbella shirazensis]|uniref:Putative nuclease of restriction endonuclease-like (RecB) superfamily n=1 Tax=Kribbella shirazensis TaxID=1105143 RepID=A0A7X5V7I9_9ACTN|nr:PDDEXK nuclease domain-containing protein [Kribbella shirazensis]NIK55313.1 putative nuclease of restriction endonuclease-like (RecB) superfamily [Kribbella shirazensis]
MNNETPRFESAPAKSSLPTWYPDLLDRVSAHVVTGHRRAVAAANQEMLTSYWSIGKEILDRQHEEGWGTRVVDRLSTDLKSRFPTTTGYSPRNLKYMRAFAAAWPKETIVQAPLAQLPWYHHLALLTKVDTAELRSWYAAAAVDRGWSRDVLALHIESRFHERSGKAVTNFATAMPPEQSDLAQQATRDPYLFDFLGTTDGWRERELEQKLVEHVGKFLLELGQGFAFVGQQVRLELDGEEFFCDLLFYHLELRCYVVIELKAVKFDASFLGQLGLYMAVVDDVLAKDGDKPTIGLLLCRNKNRVVAEYALKGFKAPIGVAEWTSAITSSLPDEFRSALPSVAELEAELTSAADEDLQP